LYKHHGCRDVTKKKKNKVVGKKRKIKIKKLTRGWGGGEDVFGTQGKAGDYPKERKKVFFESFWS